MYQNFVQPGDPDLFNPARWPHRPYCTDDLENGLRIRPFETAIKKPYIQANPPHMRFWSLYDVDREGAALAWETAGLPMPTWIAVNPKNAHAHIAYGLSAPVLTTVEARQGPLRLLVAIESAYRAALGADTGYSGLITKNPCHPQWRSCRSHGPGYELAELAGYVDLTRHTPKQGAKLEGVGLGRNCTIFDHAAAWSYRNIRHFKGAAGGYVHWLAAVYAKCLERNADFATPMDARETYAIAKSVANWAWKKFDLAASDKRFSERQAARRTGHFAPGTQNLLDIFKA